MAEMEKHECLYNKYCQDYRNRELKNESWEKVARKFNMSPMAAEKKFRNIRTAYGRWLRKRRSNPSRNVSDFVPFSFENCEWLGPHINHKDMSLNSENGRRAKSAASDDENSPVTMSNIEFLNYDDEMYTQRNENNLGDTPIVQTKNITSQEEATDVHDNKRNLSLYNHCEKHETSKIAEDLNVLSTSETARNTNRMLQQQIKRTYTQMNEDIRYQSNDEDDLYCRSLIPRIKRLEPKAKAYVRLEIEKLLYHTEYSNPTSGSASFTDVNKPTSFPNGDTLHDS